MKATIVNKLRLAGAAIAMALLPARTMAQANDSIDQCLFVAVYDFVTRTSDKDGHPAKDSAQLAVMVGSHAAKCMEYNRTMMKDFGEWRNRDYQYGEWYARRYNLPVWFIGYPDGEVSAFDKITPNRYFYTEPLPDFAWQLAPTHWP